MSFRKAFGMASLSMVLVLGWVLQAAAADPLNTWRPRNPLPQLGNHLYGIACSDKTCVVVGKDSNPLPNGGGRILTSADGFNWTVRKSAMVDSSSGDPVIPYAAAFGDPKNDGVGIWIVVGSKGTILKSVDRGATWRTVFQGYSDNDELRGITYGKGADAATPLFVAVGKSGKVLTSRTGDTWDLEITPTNSLMNAITYGKGVFVAVGTAATSPAPYLETIITSRDGKVWEPALYGYPWNPSTLDKFMGVTYGQDSKGVYHFVAVGSKTLVSSNGKTWSAPIMTGESNVINGIANGKKRFVSVSTAGTVITNMEDPSVANWSRWVTIPPFPSPGSTSNILNGIAFFKNNFIAIGCDTKLLTSPDGQSWTERGSVLSNFFYGVAYGNGTYAAVGWSGKILTSTDKVMWEERNSGVTTSLFGITFGEGKFVAVGSNGKIVTSASGEKWTVRTSKITESLFSVAYGNGTFVAVGAGGKISTSPDGVDWTARSSGITDLFGVSYANNLFVAVGQNGRVISSPNGINWTDRTPSYSTYKAECLYGVTYGGSAFVVVGENGRILTSPDLATWSLRSSGCTNSLRAVAYANDVYIVLGSGGKILTSTTADGSIWYARTSGISYSLLGMVNGETDTLVAVGAYATILSSTYSAEAPWTLWTIKSSGTYKTLKSIAFGNKTFVAVGELGTVLTSKNGVTWDIKTLPSLSWLNGVAYGNGRFVAVGDATNNARIYTSKDNGVTWSLTLNKAYFTPSNLYSVSYGSGRFVAAGMDGIELVSKKHPIYGAAGDWWQEMYLEGCYDTKGVAYGDNTDNGKQDGTFVMVGAPNRTFLTSKTPEDLWTIRWAPFFPQDNLLGFAGIAYGDGVFTVVGPKVKIGISKDGAVNWSQVPLSDYKGTFDFTGITFGGNRTFTAVGTYGKILTSPNGESWTFRKSGTTLDLYGMIYGAGSSETNPKTYVGVGKNGMILQSGVLP